MIGTSWYEHVFIVLSIAGLRSIAPASVIYLIACLTRGEFLFGSWLGLCAIPEASFLFFVYLPRFFLLQRATPHPTLDRAQRLALFNNCLKYPTSTEFYSHWFSSPDFKRKNVIEWASWACFSSELGDAETEWEDEIDEYLEIIESRAGRTLEEGYNPQVKSMRLTIDPVAMLHRPLLWYTIVGTVDLWSSLSLAHSGFRHYATRRWFRTFPPRPLTLVSKPSADCNFSYWYRPHRSQTKPPVLFLHGIGIGLWPYISFLDDLIAIDPEVGILAIEFLPISMRITDPPPGREATCDCILRILDSLALHNVVLVSHSYGTIVTAHMLRFPALASRITAILLIDPIPFLLHLPDVAFNFVYRRPRTANQWQLWFFASRDPDIARALSRHFFWSQNVLWKEELDGKNCAVSLSGADQVVPVREVWTYLTGELEPDRHWAKDQFDVLFHQDLDHATIFDTFERRKPLLDIVDRFCSTACPRV